MQLGAHSAREDGAGEIRRGDVIPFSGQCIFSNGHGAETSGPACCPPRCFARLNAYAPGVYEARWKASLSVN